MDFSYLADPMLSVVLVGSGIAMALRDTVFTLINQKINKSDINEIKNQLQDIKQLQINQSPPEREPMIEISENWRNKVDNEKSSNISR
jgi:hypothetical protein